MTSKNQNRIQLLTRGVDKKYEGVDSNISVSRFSPLREKLRSRLLYALIIFFITSILKIYIYISWKTAKVNLCFGQCSQCPMRLVVSTTFKLLGRFKIHRNQMIKICMVYIRLALSYRQFKQSKNINLANVITQSLLILGKKNNFLFRFNGDV